MTVGRRGAAWAAAMLMLAGCYGSSATDDDDATDAADTAEAADGTDTSDGADMTEATDATDAADVSDGTDAAPDNCPGYVRPIPYTPGSGDDCRDDSDCDSMTFCLLPGVSLCGYCPPPTALCASDPDCPDGYICVEIPPPCDYCPGGPSTECWPRCTTDSCGTGNECNETTGRCSALPCGSDAECPVNTRCTGTGDAHGCSTLSCTGDGDCDCGVCASGHCISGPGVCSGPAA